MGTHTCNLFPYLNVSRFLFLALSLTHTHTAYVLEQHNIPHAPVARQHVWQHC